MPRRLVGHNKPPASPPDDPSGIAIGNKHKDFIIVREIKKQKTPLRLLFPGLVLASLFFSASPGQALESDLAPDLAYISAVRDGDIKKVQAYLAQGFNPNIVDSKNKTPLFYAASTGNVPLVKILLDHDADFRFRDPLGNTPLMWGVALNQIGAVKALLEAGADINGANKDGATPLIKAVEKGYFGMVKELLKDGADASIQDYTGRDALAWARNGRNRQIVKALEKAVEKAAEN